jgi:hypothetical protein
MDEGARQLEVFKAQLLAELETHKAGLQMSAKNHEAQIHTQQAVWQETAVRQREQWLNDLTTQREQWLNGVREMRIMFKAIIDFALVTIRSLILVNGGAIIGIVSFTGNLWGHNGPAAKATAQAITPAVGWFVGGLAAALLTSGLSYIAQVAFVELAKPRPAQIVGNACRFAAVAFAIGSFGCFIVGAYRCLAAFESPVPF